MLNGSCTSAPPSADFQLPQRTAEDLRKETVLRNTGLRHVSPLATLDLAEPSARDGRRAGAECPSPFVQKRLKLSFCERNRSRRGTRSEATQATWEARPTAKLSHAELTTEQARSAWTTRRSAWPASLELIADNHARAPQPGTDRPADRQPTDHPAQEPIATPGTGMARRDDLTDEHASSPSKHDYLTDRPDAD